MIFHDRRGQYLYNIVWLSLIWDTDWLNTVTWSTNISVCCPPQSCGGGTLIDTTHFFTQTNGKLSFPLRLYLGMLGLRWMCMHYEWTWSRGLLISKKNLKLWKSMYKVNGELSSCDITCSGRVPSREGDNNHFKWPAPTSVCSVMHVKEPTSLKEQGEIRWSGQQSNISYGNGCMMSTPRRGSIFRRLHNSV